MPELFRITLSNLALWDLGGKTELGAFSVANNHKIHLEKALQSCNRDKALGNWLRLAQKKKRRRMAS